MFSFLSHQSKEEVSIILDIGSGYVEGALVKIGQTEVPHIMFEKRVSIPMREKKDIERTKMNMLKALEEVVESLQKEGLLHLKFKKFGHQTIRTIYCVLSSPWYISQTKIIKIEKESPTAVTPQLLDKLLEDETIAFKGAVSQGEYSKNFKDTISMLESKVIRTKLNGYDTAKPIGKSAKNLEIAVYFSMAGVIILDKIKEAIRKTFNYRTLRFHSFPLVLFSGIRDLSVSPHTFILLDVREEVTDVSLVKKGLMLETITIPVGTHFFTRELGKTLDTMPQVALSFLRLYSLGKAETEVTRKIKAFLDGKKDWALQFHEALKSFFEEFFLPKTIYICADPDLMPLFVKMLEEETFPQFVEDNAPFRVIPVDEVLLKGLFKNEMTGDTSSFLPIESIFLKKVIYE